MATIETTFPGGEFYSAKAPAPDQWSRFIAHSFAGNQRVGWRELAQVCCTSHTPEDAAALFAKYPAAAKPIGEAIVELGGSDDEPKTDGGSVVFADMTFRAPALEEWEDFQDIIGQKSDKHAEALKLLAKLCDAPGKILARAETFPGDVQAVMVAITEIAGMQVKISVKKG